MIEELLLALVLAAKGVSQSFRQTFTTLLSLKPASVHLLSTPSPWKANVLACRAFLELRDFLGYISNFWCVLQLLVVASARQDAVANAWRCLDQLKCMLEFASGREIWPEWWEESIFLVLGSKSEELAEEGRNCIWTSYSISQ